MIRTFVQPTRGTLEAGLTCVLIRTGMLPETQPRPHAPGHCVSNAALTGRCDRKPLRVTHAFLKKLDDCPSGPSLLRLNESVFEGRIATAISCA